MPRRERHDIPGRRHHVLNRGIAKRVCFPDPPAKKRFLALLACAVRRGEIRVEAFVIMDTHFHLLVRSTETDLSYAMMRVMNAYVRYFNRRFKRDGPLFRSRFLSLPIDSWAYWRAVVCYIDFNPVRARLCSSAALYPFGSARLYASKDHGPRWLSRTAIENWVRGAARSDSYKPSDYLRIVRKRGVDAPTAVVRARIRRCVRGDDPLDTLERATPMRVAAWMRRKARLADGLAPWMPIAAAHLVRAAVTRAKQRQGAFPVGPRRRKWCAWQLMQAGLLHGCAGLRCADIAHELGVSASTASARVRRHLSLLPDDVEYARTAGEVAHKALAQTYGDEPVAEGH